MEGLYQRIRRASAAGPIPSGELGSLVKDLEEATSSKAPATVAQKRSFLLNWADDQKGLYSEPTDLPIARASPATTPKGRARWALAHT